MVFTLRRDLTNVTAWSPTHVTVSCCRSNIMLSSRQRKVRLQLGGDTVGSLALKPPTATFIVTSD